MSQATVSPTLNRGFTLVEMIVVLAIMAVATSSGFVAYFKYRDKQEVARSADTLAESLRLAHRMALGGVKPQICGANSLEGYLVSIVDTDVMVSAKCGSVITPIKTSTYSPEIVAVPSSFLFQVLSGATSSVSISLNKGEYAAQILVNESGTVTIGATQ